MKDAYWFKHDSNARDDPKIVDMMMSRGKTSYADWWIMVEIMREQDGYQMPLSRETWSVLAKAMMYSREEAEAFVRECIDEYHLLDSDGEVFWSASLMRRMKHWDDTKTALSDAGKKGADRRWHRPPNGDPIGEANGYKRRGDKKKKKRNIVVLTDEKNGNVPQKAVEDIIGHLNTAAGTAFRPTTQTTISLVNARWHDGMRVGDFKQVIDTKAKEWLGSDMEKFLRPVTLFGAKFEGYLNQKHTTGKNPMKEW